MRSMRTIWSNFSVAALVVPLVCGVSPVKKSWAQGSASAVGKRNSSVTGAPVVPEYPIKNLGAETSIKVGDRIHFEIEGFVPDGNERIQPQTGDPTLFEQGWYIEKPPRGAEPGTLIPIRAGKLSLGPLSIYREERLIGKTTPFELEIQALDVKAPELIGPLGLPYPWLALIGFLILGVAVLALGVYLFVRMWRGRKRRAPMPAIQATSPPLSEHEEAMRALGILEEKKFWTTGQFKPLYFGTSEILKIYFGKRYGFDAVEATSRELLVLLRMHQVDRDTLRAIETTFNRLDLVKFTDLVPPIEEAEGIVEEARRLVLETRRYAV